MKKLLIPIFLMIAMLAFVGCDDDDDEIIYVENAPEPPQGVYTVTGDNEIYVFWSGPYSNNIEEFIIKRSYEPYDNYQEIGRRVAEDNPDLDLIYYAPGFVDATAVNGQTYYYAVSSLDKSGYESDLSAEDVFDTPRPEGVVDLYDMAYDPTRSGYDFSNTSRVDYDSPLADVYVDRVDDIYYVNVTSLDTYIQDMGYHDYFDEIGWAPQDGWSEIGWFEIIEGHIYVILIDGHYYAKLWVLSVNDNSVSFAWAYQTDADNPELAPQVGDLPSHGPEYLNKNSINISINK